jgi:hypothetical protein
VPTPFGPARPRTVLSLLLSVVGGLATSTPTWDEAAHELSNSQKDVSAVTVDRVVPRLVAGSSEIVANQLPSILVAAGADEIMLLAALVDRAAHRYGHEQLQLIAAAIPGPEVHAAASGRSCDPSLAGRRTREGTP